MSNSIKGNNALDNSHTGATDGMFTGGAGNNDLDKEAFLKLLITQFQYQDPLNPMDDKEFIAQLAQFSSLEQSMLTNESMGLLIQSTDRQTTMSITNYIGKEVSAVGFGVSIEDGVASKIKYAAAEEIASSYVNILDAVGTVIRTIDLGKFAPGIQEFIWDGKKSDGTVAPNGVYAARFSGKNADGKTAIIDTAVSGRVTGTSVASNGDYHLRLANGTSVYLSNVMEVLEATPPKPPVPGEEFKGTKKNDYLVGGEGPDTIKAGAGNDIIVYDPIDKLVDGGKGFDFLIAKAEVGKNAINYEVIIRGADAESIKSLDDLKTLGLEVVGDKIDTTTDAWKEKWTDAGKGQWTSKAEDKKITIEILSEVPDPDAPVESPATRAFQNNSVNFSDQLRQGLNKSVGTVSQPLSQKTSSAIQEMMRTLKN